MAVSGSKDFSLTRSDIINAALRKIGVYDEQEAPSASDNQNASLQLNMMVKEWVIRGVDLWLRQEVTLFLQPDQQSYALGTAYAATSFAETTLTAAVAASDTALSLTSSSGMTVGDFIGIKMNSDTIHWDTIATIPNSVSVTLTTGMAGAANSGKKVYAFTTKAARPQKLLTAYRRDTSNIDTQITLIGENEYRRQSNKGSSGPPVQAWYNPMRSAGSLHVWPVDGGSTWDKLIFIGQYLPDDLDTNADNPEFPIEWGNALVWNLAAEMASEYGVTEREQQRLWAVAQAKLNDAMNYDVENASMIIAVDAR